MVDNRLIVLAFELVVEFRKDEFEHLFKNIHARIRQYLVL